jgi:hypothetical protein
MNKRQRRSDAEWQQLIERQQRSRLSAHAFCKEQGLTSKAFHKRRLLAWKLLHGSRMLATCSFLNALAGQRSRGESQQKSFTSLTSCQPSERGGLQCA